MIGRGALSLVLGGERDVDRGAHAAALGDAGVDRVVEELVEVGLVDLGAGVDGLRINKREGGGLSIDVYLSIYLHTHTHNTHTHEFVRVCVSTRTHTHTHIYICIFIYTHTHTYIFAEAAMHMCLCVCIYIYRCVCVCVYTEAAYMRVCVNK